MNLKRRFSQVRALAGIININGRLLGSDSIDELRVSNIESVYKLPFFIFVMPRKRSGYPELIEKNRFRLKDCRNDR